MSASIFAFKGHITEGGDLRGILVGPFATRELADPEARNLGGGIADLTFIRPVCVQVHTVGVVGVEIAQAQ